MSATYCSEFMHNWELLVGSVIQDEENADEGSAYTTEEAEEEEEDIAEGNNVINNATVPSLYVRRKPNPSLPDTVRVLTTDEGGKVYLVGTAHFSERSQEDVSQVIT